MPVVTMSGTLGSGAREVGQAVAELLSIDFVDQQLLVDAAHRLGVTVDTMLERDERSPGFGERLAGLLRNFLERSAVAVDPLAGSSGLEVLLSRTYAEMATEESERSQEVDDTVYRKTMTVLVKELASKGNIVILGRGSQVILRDHLQALHVLTIAPLEVRIQRYGQREGLSLEEAAKRVHERDRGWIDFHRKFWKVDVTDPTLYDLTIDTAKLSYEVGAGLIAMAARAK